MASLTRAILAVLGALAPVALAVPFGPLPRSAACDRASLLAAADAYVAGQTAGKLDALSATASTTWKYVENNKELAADRGVLVKPLKIDNRRTIVDLVSCATYTELISVSGPYVIGTQIHHDSTDGKVKLVDSVASTTGSWLFNPAKTLSYVQPEKWDPIPPEKQDSRALIKAVGDAYMDMWSNSTAHLTIPWGTPCSRTEGGASTGNTCNAGIPSNHNQAPNSNRRYVIDEAMGSVSILCVWEHMMNAADAHEFRLEGGKLRFIHTMTECGGRTCRL